VEKHHLIMTSIIHIGLRVCILHPFLLFGDILPNVSTRVGGLGVREMEDRRECVVTTSNVVGSQKCDFVLDFVFPSISSSTCGRVSVA
jgi:hypothetical protein